LFPVGRPGGRVARDDNAMCWDGYLLLCSGGKKPAGRATRDECLERQMCVATVAGRTTPRMRKALPMGRAAHRASRGVPGVVPPGEPGRRLQEPAPGFRCSYPPAGLCWASVPGHRHVRSHQCDAVPTRIAAAVRRAVTAAGSDGPSVSRRAQWPQRCSSRRVSRGCWQHTAVSHAPDDLPDGQRWCLQHAPDLIQMPLRHLARRRLCGLAAGRWRRSRRRAMLAVADGLRGCLLRSGFARRPELEHAFHGLLDQPVEVGDGVVHAT